MQLVCKDKNLRQFYKDLKDGHSKSGHNRDTWPYFELMDSVFGDRPLNRPRALLDTLQQETPLSLATAPSGCLLLLTQMKRKQLKPLAV